MRLSVYLCSMLSAIATVASAQDYPTKPVRIIVPFTATGGTDIVARSLAQRLTETLGQQVLVAKAHQTRITN